MMNIQEYRTFTANSVAEARERQRERDARIETMKAHDAKGGTFTIRYHQQYAEPVVIEGASYATWTEVVYKVSSDYLRRGIIPVVWPTWEVEPIES